MTDAGTTTETPTAPGEYEFKGTVRSNSEWIEPVSFPDWSPAEVFLNDRTQRLNARVKGISGECSDFIGLFVGQWRAKRSPSPIQEEPDVAAALALADAGDDINKRLSAVRALNAAAHRTDDPIDLAALSILAAEVRRLQAELLQQNAPPA